MTGGIEGVSDEEDPVEETPEAEPAPAPAEPTPATEVKKRLPSGFSTIRDIITFTIGVVLILYEVVIPDEVRPYVLAVGLTMAGLPLVFGADERRKDSK